MADSKWSEKKALREQKLKAVSQEERLHKCKEHLMNLLKNPSEFTDESSIIKHVYQQIKKKTNWELD